MDCLFMTSFYVWLNLTRGSFSRFFGFDAEFGKGLFGFVAEPLEHAHSICLQHETVLFLRIPSDLNGLLVICNSV